MAKYKYSYSGETLYYSLSTCACINLICQYLCDATYFQLATAIAKMQRSGVNRDVRRGKAMTHSGVYE